MFLTGKKYLLVSPQKIDRIIVVFDGKNLTFCEPPVVCCHDDERDCQTFASQHSLLVPTEPLTNSRKY